MDKLYQFIANWFDVPVEDIESEMNLRDHLEDSLEYVEFIIAVEELFDLDLPDEDINLIITVQDLEDYINKPKKD